MSRADQIVFLSKLDAEMSKKKGNKLYRRQRANRKFHNFSMSVDKIIEGISDFLVKNYIDDLKNADPSTTPIGFITDKEIATKVQSFVTKIRNKINTLPAETVVKEPNWDKVTSFSVGFNFEDNDVYRKIYRLYQKEIGELAAEVAEELTIVLGGKKQEIKGKQIANLSHALFQGVIENYIYDIIDNARQKQTEIDHTSFKRWVETQTEDSGVLEVIRDSKNDTMSVEIGSSVLNAEEGRKAQNAKRQLRDLVREGLEKLRADPNAVLVELGGSDSFKTKHRKKVVKAATDPFIKKTKAKVKRENVKPQESRTHTKGKKKGSNTFSTKNPSLKNKKASGAAPRFAKKGVASQPFEMLIGVLNSKLPQVVAKNMGPPRLAFRTGRFARSTRITDIATTGKGFPSVGYTYMRGPYETFEVGNRQGSTDRDPRKLIDLSIREIAAEYAIGRFFTRRV